MQITQEYNLTKILAEMDSNLAEMRNYHSQGKDYIDLNISAKWVTPIHLLALSALSNNLTINLNCNVSQTITRKYIDRIHFPLGTSDIVSSGTAIPLTKLDTLKDDEILSQYENRILRDVPAIHRSNFTNTLKYMTSELTTNIREHSDSKDYWILAQFWPSSNTCEIAIADTGKGYLESYRGTPFEVDSHHDAIDNALDGRSSKDDKERGAGIPSTVKIFTEGYGGKFVLMTGDAIRVIRGGISEPYGLSSYWPGALICLRFDIKKVNIYPYLSGN